MNRIIHQIWVGPYPMPQRERGFVEKMRRDHPTFEHRLWTDANLPPLTEPVLNRFTWRMGLKDYAFAADVLRAYVVHRFGGVYLDVDTESERGFAGIPIDDLDGIFRHHGDGDVSFSNDFLGMRQGHPLGAFLIESMTPPAYDFGPHWLGATVRRFFGLHREAPHADVRQALRLINMGYMPSNKDDAAKLGADPWEGHFHNRALFSWSDENRVRFEKGLMP